MRGLKVKQNGKASKEIPGRASQLCSVGERDIGERRSETDIEGIDPEKVSGQQRNMEILNEFQQERDTPGHLLLDASV